MSIRLGQDVNLATLIQTLGLHVVWGLKLPRNFPRCRLVGVSNPIGPIGHQIHVSGNVSGNGCRIRSFYHSGDEMNRNTCDLAIENLKAENAELAGLNIGYRKRLAAAEELANGVAALLTLTDHDWTGYYKMLDERLEAFHAAGK